MGSGKFPFSFLSQVFARCFVCACARVCFLFQFVLLVCRRFVFDDLIISLDTLLRPLHFGCRSHPERCDHCWTSVLPVQSALLFACESPFNAQRLLPTPARRSHPPSLRGQPVTLPQWLRVRFDHLRSGCVPLGNRVRAGKTPGILRAHQRHRRV